MKREDALLLSQLLNALNDAVETMEKYYHDKNVELFESAKKEVINLQRKIRRRL